MWRNRRDTGQWSARHPPSEDVTDRAQTAEPIGSMTFPLSMH